MDIVLTIPKRLTHALEIPVREWAFGRDGFGSGHTFNEIFSYQYNKWVFVDGFNGILVEDETSGVPLSVLEFRSAIINPQQQALKVVQLGGRAPSFQTQEEAITYYAKSANYFYMLWGNNVFQYDEHPVVKMFSGVARPLERLGAMVAGVYPQIRLLKTSDNESAIAKILTLRLVLFGSFFLLFLLVGYLIFLLFRKHKAT